MKPIEAMVLLMCAVIGVVLVGQRLKLPYPIALVIGGFCISLVPGLPHLRINPELVFLVFLPPLLYAAAWFTSWHDFKANFRPIMLLAVGLVIFTTIVVGVVMHLVIPEMPLSVAFAFGAIVSPPDAVAATALAQQLHLPKRLVTVLEGESLVNDATGLIALRFALAAVVSGSFSLGHAAAQFVWVVVGGLGVGLVVAMAVARLAQFLKDDSLLIAITLVTPYLAYLPAERLHVSGVLAAVAAGIHGGWKGVELSASTRLHAGSVWNVLVFLMNCVLFILIGLQLPEVVSGLGNHSLREALAYGAIASAAVILIRPVWVFPATWLPRLLSKRLRQQDPLPRWQVVTVLSWSGMRGVVSLAAALALPATLESGAPLPLRNLVIFMTFCVIFATLVLQGLTVPALVHWLGVKEAHDSRRERDARLKLAHAALARLNEISEKNPTHETAFKNVVASYQSRIEHLSDELAEVLGWSSQHEQFVASRTLRLEAIKAERNELIKLRRQNQLDEELMYKIQRELDLAETGLRIKPP